MCVDVVCSLLLFFKQKTAYEMRISDWSSDVCSSDLRRAGARDPRRRQGGDRRCAPVRPLRRPGRSRRSGEPGGRGRIAAAREEFHRRGTEGDRRQGSGGGGEGWGDAARIGGQNSAGAGKAVSGRRSEERSVGKEVVRMGRYRGWTT